jgi:hypothetical protein
MPKESKMKSISKVISLAGLIAVTLACGMVSVVPTPYPTYTPNPTYTPYPTDTPTPYPTYTLYPTYTPEASLTPTPSFPFALTIKKYHETDNLESACGQELGSMWRIADWNDILAYSQAGNSIEGFVSALALKEITIYLVTNNGESWYSGQRHYYMEFHNHNLPSGFWSHADIDNHYIDLGSWYGLEAEILCYKS